MGTYVSDHTMIKAGAVQLANNGYLILNIRDVLLNQGVWEGLKRVIKVQIGKGRRPVGAVRLFRSPGDESTAYACRVEDNSDGRGLDLSAAHCL